MSGEAKEPTASDQVAAIAVLGEPTRRALYERVVATGGWVSRDDAADAVGIERATAAHHLDRLAEEGLLEVEYRRISGRSGPGAGRPAKLYRRAAGEFGVALPPRDYELAGRLLAEAVDRARVESTDIATAVTAVARDAGSRIGTEISRRVRGRGGRNAQQDRAVLDVLGAHGFEPEVEPDGTVVLRNCPFHRLARDHTDLICGMNLCLLEAALDGGEIAGMRAHLDPEDGRCCVKLRPTG